MTSTDLVATRRTELVGNLERVRARVGAAAAQAGRAPEEITIVAITKTWPADDVRLLAGLGIEHVGENRDQEARPKAEACAELGLTWHFVGQLQRNKAASVVGYAGVVESVDRPELVAALERAAQRAGHVVSVCLQVDLSDSGGQPGRGGARAEHLAELADLVTDAAHLDLAGVMAVAPLGADPRIAFERLAAVHDRLLVAHPSATMRSAGMSGDLEAAILAGATHIRLGSALLGHRLTLK